MSAPINRAGQTCVVVGLGMSTKATSEEVTRLIRRALDHEGLAFPPTAIATRSAFVDDQRLQVGCQVIGFDDSALIEHSEPVARTIGLPARVAETAASLAAGPSGRVIGPVHRSAHATAAVAVTSCTGAPIDHSDGRQEVTS